MIKSGNLDFSFSGLKTAVLYLVKKIGVLDDRTKAEIAREFEDAVTDVMIEKVIKARETYGVKTLILGGGVVANKHIREAFENLAKECDDLTLKIPEVNHATDNALMIACATYINVTLYPELLSRKNRIIADGNLKLGKNI